MSTNNPVIVEFGNLGTLLDCLGYGTNEIAQTPEAVNEEVIAIWDQHLLPLSVHNLIDIGNAYGSFSIGEIDQGIHLLLPVTNSEGEPENEVFMSLFNDYFHHLPHFEHLILAYNEAYMGALSKWLLEVHDIKYGGFIDMFDRFAR